MKSNALMRLGVAACAAAVLSSCASSTQLTKSWADPGAANRSYQKLVIVGVSANTTLRRSYEDSFVEALKLRSVPSTPSYTFTGEGPLDRAAVNAKVKEMGADAVLVTRLVDQETVDQTYPPSYSTAGPPPAYHAGWHGYYSIGYKRLAASGSSSADKVYRLETCLFDTRNDNLLWSGLTQTTLLAGEVPESQVKTFIATLMLDMEKYKLVPKLPKPEKPAAK